MSPSTVRPDAPIVAAQPGAWFDGDGNLSVVGAGRRLLLVLSAPIGACASAFDGSSQGAELSQRASLPFRVLGDACRRDHPTILLPEESEAASPSELERSYHDVVRCAALDLSASAAWVPDAIAASDPCPSALGLGWRLPLAGELHGLGVDERKAVAGALFDVDDRGGFGSLLLYARLESGELGLATLSPNSSERAPRLDPEQRAKPFTAAALRCVRDSQPAAGAPRPSPPPLPNAASCLRELRAERASLKSVPPATPPELVRLDAWTKQLSVAPGLLYTEPGQRELLQLLAAPAIESIAREAREERALTDRYAELAEGLDAPNISESERQRRKAEFDTLRKLLSGQIARSAVAAGANQRQLLALLTRLQSQLADAERAKKAAKKAKRPFVDPAHVQARLSELQGAAGAKAAPPPPRKTP